MNEEMLLLPTAHLLLFLKQPPERNGIFENSPDRFLLPSACMWEWSGVVSQINFFPTFSANNHRQVDLKCGEGRNLE